MAMAMAKHRSSASAKVLRPITPAQSPLLIPLTQARIYTSDAVDIQWLQRASIRSFASRVQALRQPDAPRAPFPNALARYVPQALAWSNVAAHFRHIFCSALARGPEHRHSPICYPSIFFFSVSLASPPWHTRHPQSRHFSGRNVTTRRRG